MEPYFMHKNSFSWFIPKKRSLQLTVLQFILEGLHRKHLRSWNANMMNIGWSTPKICGETYWTIIFSLTTSWRGRKYRIGWIPYIPCLQIPPTCGIHKSTIIKNMEVSWSRGTPKIIINFRLGFSHINHPAIGVPHGTPYRNPCVKAPPLAWP